MNNQENTNYNPVNHYGEVPPELYRGTEANYQQMTGGQSANRYKGAAIASLITGICSMVFSFYILLSLILAACGLTTGIIYMRKRKDSRGMAIAGVITSVIGATLAVLLFVCLILFMGFAVTLGM